MNKELKKINDDVINLRHEEINKLLNLVNIKKNKLIDKISNNNIDKEDALFRNKSMIGTLGKAWGVFIELDKESQIRFLRDDSFNGMSWQSLLQCNPYLKDSNEK